MYRYDVNAIKIVFGCNYRYSFNDEADGFEAVDASTPEKVLNPKTQLINLMQRKRKQKDIKTKKVPLYLGLAKLPNL